MTTSRRLGVAVAALIAGSASVLAAPASASPSAIAPANIVAASPSAAQSARGGVQTCSQAYFPLPDPDCQPGSTNPDVNQDNIDDSICVSGWTRTEAVIC